MMNTNKFNNKVINKSSKTVNQIPKMVVMNRKILASNKIPKQIEKK